MTRIVIIEQEPDAACEICGKIAELRPYGPNREKICFECGNEDPDMTARRFVGDVLGIKRRVN